MSATNSNSKSEYTVLYIEDMPAIQRLVAVLLARRGDIQMLDAEEPSLGIELAKTHKPDLILLDINLPGMNGYEVLTLLRESDVCRHIPVIGISANALPSDIEKARLAGFDEYITKPMNVTVLMQAVDDLLIKKSA